MRGLHVIKFGMGLPFGRFNSCVSRKKFFYGKFCEKKVGGGYIIIGKRDKTIRRDGEGEYGWSYKNRGGFSIGCK